MKIQTITSWNNKLHKEYAHRFEKTYNWPFDLLVYNEDVDMFDKIPDLKKFIEKNKNREVESFKKDGVRFSYKVYAYTHAIENASSDIDGLICIDADSVFYKSIDVDWIKKHIHKDDCMMSYLGRGSNYSECGFLYFNMKHNQTRNYARYMKKMYDFNEIYSLNEYHDSYVWDYVRKVFESELKVKNNNIGDDKGGHVQARSILGTVYDHTKGKRKLVGKSPEIKL
tara:strand:+ start:2220 stop:2897 length:678 start_codon:yes stop_codon:yes gene_type:complete